MKLVVASDSHSRDILDRIRAMEPDADLYIHCGDGEEDPARHPDWVFVKGNCDFHSTIPHPRQRIIQRQGVRIFVCHGDGFPFFERDRFMALAAKKHDCSLVLYGHTHVAETHKKYGVEFVNPGSCWKSKDGRPASYAVIRIHGPRRRIEFRFEPDWEAEDGNHRDQ